MKIRTIELKEHPILKDLNIDFLNNEGKAEELIIITGENGTGKTSLLEAILEFFSNENIYNSTPSVTLDFSDIEKEIIKNYEDRYGFLEEDNCVELFISNLKGYSDFRKDNVELNRENFIAMEIIKPAKIIYMPTVTSFLPVESASDKFKYEYKFINIIDLNIIKDIPSYIATKVKLLQKENEEQSYRDVKEKVSNEINTIFKDLELEIKMVGFTPDERDLPLFSNFRGETFDINHLSSGEKQIFLRALSLKMVEAENAIILIDEPEISLHPKWQKKIIKMYENIGGNNQIIIATNSSHIIESVPKSKIRICKKN